MCFPALLGNREVGQTGKEREKGEQNVGRRKGRKGRRIKRADKKIGDRR